MMAGILNKS